MKQKKKALGLDNKHLDIEQQRRDVQLYINLKLASTGQPYSKRHEFMVLADDLLQSYREKNRHLLGYLCPIDQRIQDFLDSYLSDCLSVGKARLPSNSLVLDKYGVARELSLPADSDEFSSDIVKSYRVRQGILHNPANDRRTTEGSFHIAEGGLPIPGDKKAVPKATFARLLISALNPPDTLLELPFTANEKQRARLFVSLLLRPVVCPEIPNFQPEKSMEIRCFAPGNLVSNLDFLESIFGNAGNPYLADHDAALDVDHWSGHTGCIILAPHLTQLTKQELGLPHYDDATARQRADGMCWQDSSELYNNGNAFKITARDERGVIVTVLADNYYGYCKKEVKTQISYATNLYGLSEEEHAGGALAFVCHNHGEEYDSTDSQIEEGFADMLARYGERMNVQPQGYAFDNEHADVIYMQQRLRVDLAGLKISWTNDTGKHEIALRPEKTYVLPNGYKLEMHKHPAAPSWRLIGIDAEGVFCHKPCTVSGGGKSEISKSLNDAVIYGPVFVHDFNNDMDKVEAIFNMDYSTRFKADAPEQYISDLNKPLLELSLGATIKLLTPSQYYTDEFNDYLHSIERYILSQVFMIKRMYRPELGKNWREHFSVDVINGHPGHALKMAGRELVASYLRVGQNQLGNWNTYKLRQDFIATEKVAMEDDISASVVVSSALLPNLSPKSSNPSVKLVKNCEYRFFQRPDDAIHRGFDKQAEYDMAQHNVFIANFEPLKGEALAAIVDDVVEIEKYTHPMRQLLQKAHKEGNQYVVSSANPRLINGKPTKNPRYLQLRPDWQHERRTYIAEMGTRLARRVPLGQPVINPVNAVLTGRRNNPPEPTVRSLAVFNPIHYQELPELFMDFICSVTGKSPSTTSAGSEGALTKGPFNALCATADLNNTLVSFMISGYAGFSSAASYIGPNLRVDHDVSLLIPEIWARLSEKERTPEFLINNGYLDKLEDYEYEGQKVLKSRLGYRINSHFVAGFMGKIFDNPSVVMNDLMLKPELQNEAIFVDGVNNIVEAQQKAAQQYLDDGSIEFACPPLKALLTIMATGSYHGMDAHHPDIRAMFTREALLASDWYAQRLKTKQAREIALWEKHSANLQQFLAKESHADVALAMDITGRLQHAAQQLAYVKSADYLANLSGTIGADLLGAYS